MEPKKRQPLNQYIKIVLVLLGLVLVVLFVLLVRQYLALRRENLINQRELSLSTFVQKHGPLDASEVGVIHSRMTFDYINRIFGLPKDYLATQLNISDPRYPDITLSEYSSANMVDSAQTVRNVQSAVAHYFNQPAH